MGNSVSGQVGNYVIVRPLQVGNSMSADNPIELWEPTPEALQEPLTHGRAQLAETTRSVAWCSASDWSAPDGSGLLTLRASSVQTDREGSCRIVWMIKRMIKSHPNGTDHEEVGH
jgi:hypothetical protein